jgi:hypothetical protein
VGLDEGAATEYVGTSAKVSEVCMNVVWLGCYAHMVYGSCGIY